MIKVYISNSSEEFVKEVNHKIAEFIKFYIAFQEDHDDNRYEIAFPKFLLRNNKTRCEEVISELYEYSVDRYIHILSPLHEYALFKIIEYCEDNYEDYEKDKTEGETSLFGIVDKSLSDEEDNNSVENGGYSLSDFHTFDFYYDNIFEDFDFLDVDFFYNKFKLSPSLFYENVDVNLDDYIELMPLDIQKEYLTLKESNNKITNDVIGEEVEVNVQDFINELSNISPGKQEAKKYENLMARILSFLFSPHLIEPRTQVKTFDEREIIDMTFYNSATHGFWGDIKIKYRSNIIAVEFKNKEILGNEDYFQISSRLNDDIGRFGILVVRKANRLDMHRAYRRLHGGNVIITLSDTDIIAMLKTDATSFIANKYRKFIEKA
ncbi:hypothetical protein FC678_24655 [Peribacillus simplex]|uniref:Restriction endonuclease type IV Mrr domain-containing protein n=1 Tax=Peribacillus simplex TaxID=1478 RepID=A0A9X8ZCN4_9BACI|nr:hypothetical protein [Peribacillus simplex]TKH04406.1 hypothetical protein FC678_24655 [Peribacillus simplex]